MTATNADLLFAQLATGDFSVIPALADALRDEGRDAEASILTGGDCGACWVVPAFGLVTSARPDFSRDERGHRNVMEVREVGFGVSHGHPTRRTLRGRPMHWRAAATRAAFDRAVSNGHPSHRVEIDGRSVTVYVVDAAEYGLTEVTA